MKPPKRKAREWFLCYGDCPRRFVAHLHEVSIVGESFGRGLVRVRQVLRRPKKARKP